VRTPRNARARASAREDLRRKVERDLLVAHSPRELGMDRSDVTAIEDAERLRIAPRLPQQPGVVPARLLALREPGVYLPVRNLSRHDT
ncbi:MAG: hypothetical protein QOI71_3141, partial [Gaiellales bacterium]|nr:hypothetical protein [Gaiellales bacterium]